MMGDNSHRQVSHRVARHFAHGILCGHHPEGSHLPTDRDICGVLSVGRADARRGLQILAAKGLVAVRPNRPPQVLPSRHWNVLDADVLSWLRQGAIRLPVLRDLIQLRRAIEPEAAALAAGAADLTAVHRAHDTLRALHLHEHDPVETEAGFHLAILTATGNPFYQPFGPMIRVAIQGADRLGVRSSHRGEWYAAMIAALTAHDGDAARRLMQDKLDLAAVNLREG